LSTVKFLANVDTIQICSPHIVWVIVIVVRSTLELVFLVACQKDYSTGILWPRHEPDQLARVRCSSLHSSFRSGVYITRMCYSNGEWSDVDISACTMRTNTSALVMVETHDHGNATLNTNEVCNKD